MDKIHEIAGDGAPMPRFDDGMVSMVELIRVMAESLVNEIMGAQADEACENGNRRNGYRERKLVIDLGIPKLRAGSYLPEDLIERYPRVDRAVIAAVPEMVANGVSTGKVKRVAQAMGIDRMSSSQVPRICSSLDESVADLQERGLSDVAYPYIWLDATCIKCRDAGRVQSTALVTAIGAGSGWCRRLLGLDAIDAESLRRAEVVLAAAARTRCVSSSSSEQKGTAAVILDQREVVGGPYVQLGAEEACR